MINWKDYFCYWIAYDLLIFLLDVKINTLHVPSIQTILFQEQCFSYLRELPLAELKLIFTELYDQHLI